MISTVFKTSVVAVLALKAMALPVDEAPKPYKRPFNHKVSAVQEWIASTSQGETLCTPSKPAVEKAFAMLNEVSPLASDCETMYQWYKNNKGHHKFTGFLPDTTLGDELYLANQNTCKFGIMPSTPSSQTNATEYVIGNEDVASLLRDTIDRWNVTFKDGLLRTQAMGNITCGGKELSWDINYRFKE